MSGSIKLTTPGSGSVSLTPASSIASDVTVNVPSQNCTLDIQGPAFSVYRNASQTVTINTYTKVAFNTELFDTGNCFDSTTNYRFTPNVAGYYLISGATQAGGLTVTLSAIYKNGSLYCYGSYVATSSSDPISTVSSLIYFNGTTDYVELYSISTAGNIFNGNQATTYFNGSLVRAA